MNVRLLAPAATELDEAVAWYAAQAPGLERRFIDEAGGPETDRRAPAGMASARQDGRLSALGNHRVWDLTVRCWGAHNRLAQELDHVGDGRNAQTIDALGDDRRDTAMELARTASQTLHGVLWKKDILLLFLGSDEEARALLSSCLRSY